MRVTRFTKKSHTRPAHTSSPLATPAGWALSWPTQLGARYGTPGTPHHTHYCLFQNDDIDPLPTQLYSCPAGALETLAIPLSEYPERGHLSLGWKTRIQTGNNISQPIINTLRQRAMGSSEPLHRSWRKSRTRAAGKAPWSTKIHAALRKRLYLAGWRAGSGKIQAQKN